MRRVLAFYKFVSVPDPDTLRDNLESAGERLQIKGTILLAEDGINGTIVGEQEALATFQELLTEQVGVLPFKWSELECENQGFYRFKVRVKPEIVSFGVPDLEITNTGEHVSPARFNELLADPDVVVIDTRNTYEVDIGTFPSAMSPQTTNFREFPQWVSEQLDPDRNQHVAMFCTGGIRCEKASAYMLSQGFANVYQLDGGILKYLEQVDPDENRWQGECFVFDQRVSVNSDLEQGQYQQCFACRHPLSEQDLASDQFEQGVSCPHCVGAQDEKRTESLRERQRQVQLAEERGTQHIGQPQQ
jgi:UPF0176 protein